MKTFILSLLLVCMAGVCGAEEWRECPRCGHVTRRSEIKFCWRDGSKLNSISKKYICPKCKKELTSVDAYCEYCGAYQRTNNE